MKSKILSVLALAGILTASIALAQTTSHKFDKVVICHQSGNGNYERLVTSPNAINGHFNADGSPKEGHSGDLLFEGDEAQCPSGGGGGGGGGGGNECVPPTAITDVAVDTGVLNDHKMTVTWAGGTGSTNIKINYGWDENNLSQTVTVPNTGTAELTGLTNGIHYWVQLIGLKEGCPTDPSIKVDPLP